MVTYVSLSTENKNNSTTCKFAYILDDCVFFVFHKIKNKKTSKDKKREKEKHTSKRKRKTNSVWLCLISLKCTGSVNCALADWVTSYIGSTSLSLNAKENMVFHSIRPSLMSSVRNIAMHFKIMLCSENYNFFNILKFFQNLTF